MNLKFSHPLQKNAGRGKKKKNIDKYADMLVKIRIKLAVAALYRQEFREQDLRNFRKIPRQCSKRAEETRHG
jgi:hypothetical protein